MELTERNFLRQAPALVNGKFSITKSESDLVLTLLTEIKKDDEDFKDYTFTKADLEGKMGIKIHSKQLDKTTDLLMSRVIKIDNGENDWQKFSWFSYFAYKNGVITCRFDKKMKPYLLELKQFVMADLRHIILIKSEYSRRMYMLLAERAKFGEREFIIEELMKQFEVPKSLKIYNRFKEKVLNQAVKDITKYTDLEVTFTETKRLRKVVSVTFTIKKNTSDLKTFIEWIRELHSNQDLIKIDDKTLRCSTKGLLYFAENSNDFIDEKRALKYWDLAHNAFLNHTLLFNEKNLFDF